MEYLCIRGTSPESFLVLNIRSNLSLVSLDLRRLYCQAYFVVIVTELITNDLCYATQIVGNRNEGLVVLGFDAISYTIELRYHTQHPLPIVSADF